MEGRRPDGPMPDGWAPAPWVLSVPPMDVSQQLAWLQRHPVLAGMLPRYRRLSLVHWESLGPRPRSMRVKVEMDALAAVPDFREVARVVRVLGRARHVPALPALVSLWEGCLVAPVRTAAGHALFDLDTAGAFAALLATADDHDSLCAHLVAKAALHREGTAAFDRYERYEAPARRGDTLAVHHLRALLGVLAPGGQRPENGRWVNVYAHPDAPAWLRADPRWGELAAGLRAHPQLGPLARLVLAELSPAERALALARAPASEATWPGPGRTTVGVLTEQLVRAPAPS